MPNVPVAFTQPQGADPWLRGNVRPVLVAAAATMLSGSLIITALIAFAAPAWLQGVVGVLLAAGTATTAALAVESARPRLSRRGDMLIMRLAPWHEEAVPLAVVECFFLGSSPVGKHPASSCCGGSDDAASELTSAARGDRAPVRRRGTLAIRLAERAEKYSQRAISLPWGGWARGTIVVDGMWCEPLTPTLLRDLTDRLVAAKREAT